MTAPTHITVRVPLRIRRRPGRKTIVTPVVDGLPVQTTTRADPTLLKALARAFWYQRMLDDGRYASISEMAAAEKLDRGYLGRLLQLTLLAPDIVEGILSGHDNGALALPRLLEALLEEWQLQRRRLAIAHEKVKDHLAWLEVKSLLSGQPIDPVRSSTLDSEITGSKKDIAGAVPQAQAIRASSRASRASSAASRAPASLGGASIHPPHVAVPRGSGGIARGGRPRPARDTCPSRSGPATLRGRTAGALHAGAGGRGTGGS